MHDVGSILKNFVNHGPKIDFMKSVWTYQYEKGCFLDQSERMKIESWLDLESDMSV